MITPSEERIIQRAAKAKHAYWRLVSSHADDAMRRQAIMLRMIAVQNELRDRGDARARPPGDPLDMSVSLEEAVRRELVALTPGVRIQVAARRERRRLAVNCGPVQLVVSYASSARRHLRALIQSSSLSIREVASVFGYSASTLERHLAGDTISRTRRDWYNRLEAIESDGEFIHVVVRHNATRKKWGWRLSRAEKKRLFAGER